MIGLDDTASCHSNLICVTVIRMHVSDAMIKVCTFCLIKICGGFSCYCKELSLLSFYFLLLLYLLFYKVSDH